MDLITGFSVLTKPFRRAPRLALNTQGTFYPLNATFGIAYQVQGAAGITIVHGATSRAFLTPTTSRCVTIYLAAHMGG